MTDFEMILAIQGDNLDDFLKLKPDTFSPCDEISLAVDFFAEILHNKPKYFHLAVFHASKRIIDYMLPEVIEQHCKDGDGKYPIHFAAASGDVEVFQLISTITKDIMCLDYHRRSCIFDAVKYNRDTILDYIWMNVPDIITSDIDGYTPLHIAINSGLFEMAQKLITIGYNIEDIAEGYNCAFLIQKPSNKQMFQLLIDNGINLRKVRFRGLTLLNYWIQKENFLMIKAVLEFLPKDAIYDRDDYNVSPIERARHTSNKRIIGLIESLE